MFALAGVGTGIWLLLEDKYHGNGNLSRIHADDSEQELP